MPANSHREPPTDVDAEMALLGAMLAAGNERCAEYGWTFEDVTAIVRSEAFTIPDHRFIFETTLAAHDAGEPIDMLGIVPRLQAAQPRQGNAWRDLTIELAESHSAVANAPYYARMVRNAWQRREFIRACIAAQDDAYNPLTELSDVSVALANKLDRIESAGAVDRSAIREAEALAMLTVADDAAEIKVRIPGLPALEHALDGGFDAGSLSIIGARRSCGKTGLALFFCVNQLAVLEGVPALFISAEMPTRRISERLLSMRTGLALREIRSGRVDDASFRTYRNQAVIQAGNGKPLYIMDNVRDVHHIVSIIRHYIRKHAVGLVAVDYLGRLAIRGRFDRHDLKIAAMSEAFKNLADDTGVPVVLCVQLNRDAERNPKPSLADLKDSGSIEADADTVILIHRDRENRGTLSRTSLIIAKQRQGETGTVEVDYHVPTQTYRPARISPSACPEEEYAR